MRHLATLAFCLASVVPAAAQINSPGPQPNAGSGGAPARTFVLRNEAGDRITAARVVTTDGQTVDLLRGLGPLAAAEGRNVLVPGRSCIRDVYATLQNGRQLAISPGNDCQRSIIEVKGDSIQLSSASAGPASHPD